MDFFLVSQTVALWAKRCEISPSVKSDHKLVTLTIDQCTATPRGQGYWTLNNALLHDKDYIEQMKKSITEFLADNPT